MGYRVIGLEGYRVRVSFRVIVKFRIRVRVRIRVRIRVRNVSRIRVRLRTGWLVGSSPLMSQTLTV